MNKSFLFGISFLGLVILTSLIFNDWNLIIKISGVVGLVSLLISGIFVGAFVNGDRMRANFSSESKSDRERRTQYASIVIAFGSPNLLAAIVYLFMLSSNY